MHSKAIRFIDACLAGVFYILWTIITSTKEGVVAGYKAFMDEFNHEKGYFRQFVYDIYMHPNCKKLPKKKK